MSRRPQVTVHALEVVARTLELTLEQIGDAARALYRSAEADAWAPGETQLLWELLVELRARVESEEPFDE